MNLDRRGVLSTAAVVAGAAVAAIVAERAEDEVHAPLSTGRVALEADAHQLGVHRPADPQAHALLTVLDLAATSRREIRAVLERLGGAIGPALTASADDVSDLTVTVGVGPRLVRAAGDDLPGRTALPRFAGDGGLPASSVGGDLLLAVHGPEAAPLRRIAGRLTRAAGGRVRWSQAGSRSAAGQGRARNPLGFLDGVVVPRTEEELAEDVWIQAGPAAGGTICVVRRLRLDVAGFQALPVRRQERVVGRRLSDGAPLSGGDPLDQVDLAARTPEGEYVVPLHAHARAAHPSFTGSGLMLRRSYAYDNGTHHGTDDRGLLFVSFQRELATFVRTQQRLDEVDSLMHYATPTASAAFLILPGYDGSRPLGGTVFA